MNNIIFELDYQGVGQLLKGEEMRELVASYVDEAKSRVSYPGYESEVKDGGTRIIGTVWADTYDARAHEAKSNELLISIGGGE